MNECKQKKMVISAFLAVHAVCTVVHEGPIVEMQVHRLARGRPRGRQPALAGQLHELEAV